MTPRVPAAAAAVAAVLALAGCASTEEADSGEEYHPATVEEVAGSDTPRVSLTEDAAARIALETAEVRAVGGDAVVPYAALVYDGDGGSWVYVEDGSLSFVRRSVAVLRVEGDDVHVGRDLTSTDRVATTGVTEIYGAELGIDGSH